MHVPLSFSLKSKRKIKIDFITEFTDIFFPASLKHAGENDREDLKRIYLCYINEKNSTHSSNLFQQNSNLICDSIRRHRGNTEENQFDDTSLPDEIQFNLQIGLFSSLERYTSWKTLRRKMARCHLVGFGIQRNSWRFKDDRRTCTLEEENPREIEPRPRLGTSIFPHHRDFIESSFPRPRGSLPRSNKYSIGKPVVPARPKQLAARSRSIEDPPRNRPSLRGVFHGISIDRDSRKLPQTHRRRDAKTK